MIIIIVSILLFVCKVKVESIKEVEKYQEKKIFKQN